MEGFGLLELLIYGALSLFSSLIDLFPTINFSNSNITNFFSNFFSLISKASILLPLGDILAVLSIFIAFKLSMILFFVVNWTIRRIADIIP